MIWTINPVFRVTTHVTVNNFIFIDMGNKTGAV